MAAQSRPPHLRATQAHASNPTIVRVSNLFSFPPGTGALDLAFPLFALDRALRVHCLSSVSVLARSLRPTQHGCSERPKRGASPVEGLVLQGPAKHMQPFPSDPPAESVLAGSSTTRCACAVSPPSPAVLYNAHSLSRAGFTNVRAVLRGVRHARKERGRRAEREVRKAAMACLGQLHNARPRPHRTACARTCG